MAKRSNQSQTKLTQDYEFKEYKMPVCVIQSNFWNDVKDKVNKLDKVNPKNKRIVKSLSILPGIFMGIAGILYGERRLLWMTVSIVVSVIIYCIYIFTRPEIDNAEIENHNEEVVKLKESVKYTDMSISYKGNPFSDTVQEETEYRFIQTQTKKEE